ncbi:integrase [Synergistales bacterium]|nr:integrase [Synergistales bacterium]
MSLTELMIKQAKPEEKKYHMGDGHGLALEVHPSGKKYWIIRYWVAGKEKRTSAGTYPEVSLKQARDKNMDFRRSLETGKPIGADSETFATVAAEWMEKRMAPVCAESYLRTIRLRLDRIIYPAIGHMKMSDITSSHILAMCRNIEGKGNIETASRVKTLIGQIFRYAIATSRVDSDPTYALKGALQTRQEKHYSTLTDPSKIALLIRSIDAYPFAVIRCALKFSALTFCRPGEIRHAEWKEIDFEKAQWNIPPEKMKMKRPHIVPLSIQTTVTLRELYFLTGNQTWLFPSARRDGRPMSDGGIRVALRAMGYGNDDMTAHGFRAMASTVLNESGLFLSDVIERQLAHVESNSVRAAYNHAEYLPQRRDMLQWWADWLDGLNKEDI